MLLNLLIEESSGLQFHAVRTWLFGCWLELSHQVVEVVEVVEDVFRFLSLLSLLGCVVIFVYWRLLVCAGFVVVAIFLFLLLAISPYLLLLSSCVFVCSSFFFLLLKSHHVFLLYGLFMLECLCTLQAHDIYWVECKLSATFEMNPSLLWVFNEIVSWVTVSVFTHYQKSPQRG